MENKLDQQLIGTLISKIGPVDMTKIIAADRLPTGKYIIKLNGRRATDIEVDNLKREVEMFEQTSLYKMWTETLRYQAQQQMFEKSSKAEDVFVTGKLFLHAISTIEHIVWACKNPQLLAAETVVHSSNRKPLDTKKLTEYNTTK